MIANLDEACLVYLFILMKRGKINYSRLSKNVQKLFELNLISITKDKQIILTNKGKEYINHYFANRNYKHVKPKQKIF